jgi:hypothetical protein
MRSGLTVGQALRILRNHSIRYRFVGSGRSPKPQYRLRLQAEEIFTVNRAGRQRTGRRWFTVRQFRTLQYWLGY